MTTGYVSTSFSAILGSSVQAVIGTVIKFFNNQITLIVLLGAAIGFALYVIGYMLYITGIVNERARAEKTLKNSITDKAGDIEFKIRNFL